MEEISLERILVISFRVDDFPGTKPDEFWRHNLDNFKRFDEVMRKHCADYTLGVIPRYTIERDIEWMAKNELLHVALHGRHHDERYPNEFREYETEETILHELTSLKGPLDQCNPRGVDTYIPPHNVVDKKTVRALVGAGFKHLWGGPGSDRDVMAYADSLGLQSRYYQDPFEYGRSDELIDRGSVKYITDKWTDDSHVCLHWTWEWNIGLKSLDTYLTMLDDVIGIGRCY